MTFKEFCVYLIVVSIFAPFTFWIFLSRPETEVSTIVFVNLFLSMNIYSIIHTKFEFTHRNIHKEKDRRSRRNTRILGLFAQAVVSLMFIGISYPIMNNFNFLRLFIYIIPILLTLYFVLKFKDKLEEMRYI